MTEQNHIFQWGQFIAHSGDTLPWKFEADSFTDADIACLAQIAASILPPFAQVEGIASGGLRLAKAMCDYISPDAEATLIVDDVLTTGASMERQRGSRRNVIGLVICARGSWPDWVIPILCTPQAALSEAQERVRALTEALRRASNIGKSMAEWMFAQPSVTRPPDYTTYRAHIDVDSIIYNDIIELSQMYEVFACDTLKREPEESSDVPDSKTT